MELDKLFPFVLTLLLVGMIVGVGTLTLDKFAVATKTTGTVTNTENVTFTSGLGNTANDELLTLTGCYDATNKSAITVSAVGCRIANADLGNLAIPTTQGSPVNVQVNYTYKADSKSSTVLDSGRDSISGISEDWLALVVTIGVLALILGLVIAGFSYFGNRR